MRKYWVYVHTCKANGKKYVGCTTQARPELRWAEGRGYEGQLFGKAVRKYEWNNFQHEAWELTCESEMYYAEKYLIAYYHTTESEFGYNCSTGGEKGALGCKHSEEIRRKKSKAQKKLHSDPEYLKKQSKAHKKKWADPKYRKKMSEAQKKAQKKVHSDPEYLKKLSEVAKNRPRIKISLPDGTILEMTKQNLTRNYINKGRKFEYVS